MTISFNQIQLRGYIGNISEVITTEKSSFYTISLSTKRGKTTDWHKIVVFSSDSVQVASSFDLGVGDYIRVDGELTYRNRDVKDADGKIVATVKEASVIAATVFGLVQKDTKA